MPLTEVTLTASTVAVVVLDSPTGRVTVKQMSGTPAEIYVTADGALPVIPTSGQRVSGNQKAIPAVLGAFTILAAPLFGDHMAVPTIRLISAGTPTVSVEW